MNRLFRQFHSLARTRALCATVFLLLSGASVMATPLQVYREEVRRAVKLFEALPQWKKVESRTSYTRHVEAAVQQLRETLLNVETVETAGATVKVNNKWLAEALTRYEQIPAEDDERRDGELAQVTERLRALDERLTETDAKTENVGKEEEKQKLNAILQRPEYSEKANEESAWVRLKRRFREWLRSLLPKGKGLQPGTSNSLSRLAQIGVIALSLAAIIYIFWKFAPVFRRERGRGKGSKEEARVVLGERLEPGQTAADLLAEAEALARAGDLRAAIRKGYIALLCELGDRKIIGLAEHKTNRDYLRAVSQIEPLHGQMQQLTRSFEDHWYGFIPTTETDWNAFRSGFREIAGNER
jgi:hypothetical protein